MVADFASAFLLTNLVEMPVAWLFLRRSENLKRVLLVVLLCNVLTLPFVWLVFPTLRLPYVQFIAIAELFAFSIEMLIYAKAFEKSGWLRAAGAAFAANLASFVAGFII